MRASLYLMLLLPVFSITSLIGLPRLQNVALAIFIFGTLELILISKKLIKLDATLIYSWFIALGLLISISLRSASGKNPSFFEFTFPLLWTLLPFFLNYWKRSPISWSKFPDYFFLANFLYASTQLLMSRLFGYSLMIHRTFTEYQIETYSQDTPFSFLGLNGIHQFISSNIGVAVTGLVIERVDFMLLCIICIIRITPFSYKKDVLPYYKKSKTWKFVVNINLLFALFFLIVSGSSLSIFVLILPFLWITTIAKKNLSLRFIKTKLPKRLKALLSLVFFSALILFSLFYLFGFFIEVVKMFDQSRRISALNSFTSIVIEQTDNFWKLVYGSGVSTTSGLGSDEDSLLPKSLDLFGYTFNSFGLLGLVPFMACYPLLLSSQTSLKWPSIIVFCALAFAGAGSPLSYNYTYALLLLPPNDLVIGKFLRKQRLRNA